MSLWICVALIIVFITRRNDKPLDPKNTMYKRPTMAEAESAIRTLIQWVGDNPDRVGLLGTPNRVVRSYQEFFAGYDEDPV